MFPIHCFLNENSDCVQKAINNFNWPNAFLNADVYKKSTAFIMKL